jgi:hypothetical protein
MLDPRQVVESTSLLRYAETRACERSGSGAENGAERAEKLVSGSGAVSGTSEKKRGAERSAEREIGERERSGERKSKKLVERGATF